MLMMFNENNKSERKKKTRYDIGTGFVKKTLEASAH